jgi:uncharacterized protein (DUF2147 family)
VEMRPRFSVLSLFLIFILAMGLLFQSCATSAIIAVIDANSADAKQVVGEWKRTSGGYLLTIKESNGKVGANYYNPSQGYIYVSHLKISTKDEEMKVEVTLNDRNYPGSKYALVYSKIADALQGTYTYPEGTMPVNFIRVRQGS